MTERAGGGFGAPATIDPHLFRVNVPAAARGEVSIVEDYGLQGGSNGVPEQIERCRLPRPAWAAIRELVARAFNERLKEKKLPTGAWKTGDNLVDRLLGKELCVLAWGIEAAASEQIPNALRNWLALRPEERWWLFSMAAVTSGTADHVDVGWRKAIRVALTEATGEPAPPTRARRGKAGDADEPHQITLFMTERAGE